MPYDHYLFDMPDMEDALAQISAQKEEIVSVFFISDASQVCIVVKRDEDRVGNVLKTLFEKEEHDT